jgi:hypothetical protein
MLPAQILNIWNCRQQKLDVSPAPNLKIGNVAVTDPLIICIIISLPGGKEMIQT